MTTRQLRRILCAVNKKNGGGIVDRAAVRELRHRGSRTADEHGRAGAGGGVRRRRGLDGLGVGTLEPGTRDVWVSGTLFSGRKAVKRFPRTISIDMFTIYKGG